MSEANCIVKDHEYSKLVLPQDIKMICQGINMNGTRHKRSDSTLQYNAPHAVQRCMCCMVSRGRRGTSNILTSGALANNISTKTIRCAESGIFDTGSRDSFMSSDHASRRSTESGVDDTQSGGGANATMEQIRARVREQLTAPSMLRQSIENTLIRHALALEK